MMRTKPSASSSPIPVDRSFIVTHGLAGRFPYFVHAHPCFELIHFTQGDGISLVGDHRGKFKAGDLLLLAPEVPHCFHTEGFLPNGAQLEINVLYVDPMLLEGHRAPELSALSAVLARAKRGLRFARATADDILGILREMASADRVDAVASIYRAFARLARDDQAETLALQELSSHFRVDELARLGAVNELLRRRFREPLSLGDVARDSSVSISTINALLKKYMKTTFLQALTRLRLEEAKRMLQNEDRSITDIAFSAGFNSLATFNRRFRAEEETTPQEFRARHH